MTRPIIGAAAILVLTAGCGSSDSSEPAATQPAATAAATVTGAPASPYKEVTVGEPFQISNENGPTAAVTLLQIEIDPTCTTQFGDITPPEGTNVALEFDVQTTANPPVKYISDAWFEELTPEDYNRRLPRASDLCIADREGFGRDFLPNSKYRGWVLVDVSNPASSLLMSDIWDGRPVPEIHRIQLTGN
ncbi:hypothetical protein IU501_34615 [Nocardia otitidiscaviarum]|uniref:hypothetical protein n=1 Tax=Nocardia otitidiscaviarum TaxID=1823 RepID=UPI0018949C7A|nr:hypothetical protein [Nocardia otitidiscaviarum]MBF6138104.1 hypothetical protein [Nocardia otitidiscaviarum]